MLPTQELYDQIISENQGEEYENLLDGGYSFNINYSDNIIISFNWQEQRMGAASIIEVSYKN